MDSTMKFVIDVDTGNIPYRVKLFEIYFDEDLEEIWEKAGIYAILTGVMEELLAERYLDSLTGALVHIGAHPELYLVDSSANKYHRAIHVLSNVVRVCRMYPLAKLVHEGRGIE